MDEEKYLDNLNYGDYFVFVDNPNNLYLVIYNIDDSSKYYLNLNSCDCQRIIDNKKVILI